MAPSARWYLDLAAQALGALNNRTQASFLQFFEGVGNLDGMDIAFIQIAAVLEPDLLTPEILITRTPYARPEFFIENMLAAVGRGWLRLENGRFRLTEAGREVAVELFELGDRLFAKIKALPDPEMKHLLALLERVRDKIKTLSEPEEKPAFELSLRFEDSLSASTLAQIRCRMIDLLAFRDDAHVAAWKRYTGEGHLWETFTLVWREQAGSARELAEQLSYRNYDETAYAATLDKLVACGWIVKQGEKYIVRGKAARMHRRVEGLTDRLYEAAFTDLKADDLRSFRGLMEKLTAAVTPPNSDDS